MRERRKEEGKEEGRREVLHPRFGGWGGIPLGGDLRSLVQEHIYKYSSYNSNMPGDQAPQLGSHLDVGSPEEAC